VHQVGNQYIVYSK